MVNGAPSPPSAPKSQVNPAGDTSNTTGTPNNVVDSDLRRVVGVGNLSIPTALDRYQAGTLNTDGATGNRRNSANT